MEVCRWACRWGGRCPHWWVGASARVGHRRRDQQDAIVVFICKDAAVRWASRLGIGVLALTAACGGTVTDKRHISAAVVDGKPGFDPATITMTKGHKIDLNVGNRTDKTHGFTIEGYGVVRTVDPNKPIDLSFKASRTGTFRVFCQLHPAHQPAQLIVK